MASTRSAARFPDRTVPSMVAGNPVSVQSPARNRFFQAVTAPGRRAFCSGVASNVARRSRTICQGGSSACMPAALADISPDRLRQFLTRHIHQPVAIADGDRQALREREQPFHQSADNPGNRRHVLWRIEAEMRVHDRAKIWTVFSGRQQRRGGTRRHRQHHGGVGRDRDIVVAKLQFADAVGRQPERTQLMSEMDAGALVPQQLDRGFD